MECRLCRTTSDVGGQRHCPAVSMVANSFHWFSSIMSKKNSMKISFIQRKQKYAVSTDGENKGFLTDCAVGVFGFTHFFD